MPKKAEERPLHPVERAIKKADLIFTFLGVPRIGIVERFGENPGYGFGQFGTLDIDAHSAFAAVPETDEDFIGGLVSVLAVAESANPIIKFFGKSRAKKFIDDLKNIQKTDPSDLELMRAVGGLSEATTMKRVERAKKFRRRLREVAADPKLLDLIKLAIDKEDPTILTPLVLKRRK